jgi:Flp pilus assembly protein TadG
VSMNADSSIHSRNRRPQRSRGQSLVEFALVVPLFLGLLFAILDFGFLLYSRITLGNATREGAHAAVTQVDNPQGIPTIVASAIQASSTALIWSDVTVTTSCVALTANHGSCAFTSAPNAIMQGDSINVNSRYVYHSFFARFFGSTITFDTNVRMVVE